MDSEQIKDLISSTVSSFTSAVTEVVSHVNNQENPTSSRSMSDSVIEEPAKKKSKKMALPSSFLKKNKAKQKKVKSNVKSYNKDIVCLPHQPNLDEQEIPFPRGKSRLTLAKLGLIGKVTLTTDMLEGDIRREICGVFNAAFGGDLLFPFKFLQSVGCGSRCLTVPCTAPSFQWSVKDIIAAAGKNAIYILAEKDICTTEDENDPLMEGEYSWR